MICRNLYADDWVEISEIASQTRGFTIPSRYIVWMMALTQTPFCWVACSDNGKILAYLLAIRASDPETLFVWQLGVRQGLKSKLWIVVSELFRESSRSWKRNKIRHLLFTAPRGVRLTLLRQLAATFGASKIKRSKIAMAVPLEQDKPRECLFTTTIVQ